jgi:hypothetical protein
MDREEAQAYIESLSPEQLTELDRLLGMAPFTPAELAARLAKAAAAELEDDD